MKKWIPGISLSACTLLSGCLMTPVPKAPQIAPDTAWHSSLPEQTAAASLTNWWEAQQDPLLMQLLKSGLQLSPDLAAARSRQENAQSTWVAAGALFLPTVDASLSASRGRSQAGTPVAQMRQAGLQTSWELDFFGANQAARRYAVSQKTSADAAMRATYLSVSADIAQRYYEARYCTEAAQLLATEAAAWQSSRNITERMQQVGAVSAVMSATMQASAADGQRRASQQNAACALQEQALSALTGMPVAELHQALQQAGKLSDLRAFSVQEIPASVLARRPDIVIAEQDFSGSIAQADAARAQRLPRISLSGNIARQQILTGDERISGSVFSVGPVQISVPVFNGGQRDAQVKAADARVDEARIAYAARIRQALSEVNQALIQLNSSLDTLQQLQVRQQAASLTMQSTLDRQRQGMASQLEIEEARRQLALSQLEQIQARLERNRAWLGLYRAIGGGISDPSGDSQHRSEQRSSQTS